MDNLNSSQRFPTFARCIALTAFPLMAFACSPADIPPTPEEIQFRDAWAAQISPQKRAEIDASVARHTSWTEKKKIVYEGLAYQKVATNELKRKSTAKATTKPATRPSAQPFPG